ncbi:hypothetical protein GN244_ATG00480 [Phytophthora infestans]|uniref:LisH domain-containing protein n=1 Tax=Phytophthora infestans TaxID=4787 RepID=A0A833WQU3_PHYIN|nr:hypothetical protein GN244_ATG00480 [Phytophthora infestans]
MLHELQPPPTPEELALKEQVTQVLASQGVLAKLKAELRAAVFEVMHEREGFVKTNNAPKLGDFPMEIRTTALSLIVECMRFFHWEHALRVLLAETNAENVQQDDALLAKKLGLESSGSSNKPTLFQLIESKVGSPDKGTTLAATLISTHHNDFDEEDDEIRPPTHSWEPKTKSFGSEEKDVYQSPTIDIEHTAPATKDEAKVEDAESSVEIEESMMEEVPSGSELEESNFTNYEDDGSQDQNAKSTKQATTLNPRQLQEAENLDKALKESHENDNSDNGSEDMLPVAAPPPAPAKLPTLPPLVAVQSNALAEDTEDEFDAVRNALVEDAEDDFDAVSSALAEETEDDFDAVSNALAEDAEDDFDAVSNALAEDAEDDFDAVSNALAEDANDDFDAVSNALVQDAEDDFDAEEEAERLRKLDAALRAMEAEDDTGTLQQLKASLQMELQEQDNLMSSGGKVEGSDGEEETRTGFKEEQDDDEGYGSSDFEEDEEIASSDISEEMESMPELSDKEDESDDGAAVSAAAEPPQVLRNDTRVDSEDALNSYDYIEDVEKGGW